MKYFKKCFIQNYANFNGRARRKEFWHYVLWYNIIGFAAVFLASFISAFVDKQLGYAITTRFTRLLSAVFLLPSLAVQARRLHDINKSGWYNFLVLIPIIGWIILIVWSCTEGDKGDNKYGADPKSL